jgi:hypothetical protein
MIQSASISNGQETGPDCVKAFTLPDTIDQLPLFISGVSPGWAEVLVVIKNYNFHFQTAKKLQKMS